MFRRVNKKKIREKLAVSEIIGTVLMLGIASSAFSIIYYTVASTPNPNFSPIVEISGTIEENQIIVMHRGGEPLDLDTDLSLNIGGTLKSFKIGDLLDIDSKEDGFWSLGEKIIYPLEYDFDYSAYPNIDINIIDEGSNSIVMMGTTKVTPTCDLGIELEVDKQNPKQYDYIVFTLTVTNNWNINASGIKVEFLLPEGLAFIDCSMSKGSYNSSNGIWDIGTINIDSYANLDITAQVLNVGYNQTSQFVVLIDGSRSIPNPSWKLAIKGLVNAIGDESVFPQDGSVELTIIQFGVNNYCARVEIGPIVVNKNNIQDIVNQIDALKNKQGNGWTPIASGFYLANDKIASSTNFGGFNPDNKQVVVLITDGNANVVTNSGSYCGSGSNEWYGKISAANARNYLLSGLAFTADKDEIDVIAVSPGMGSIDEEFLCDDITWPQPCYDGIPPPEDDLGWPPAGSGWYRFVESWQDFYDSLNEFFGIIFNNVLVNVNIESTAFLDPKVANDQSSVVLRILS